MGSDTEMKRRGKTRRTISEGVTGSDSDGAAPVRREASASQTGEAPSVIVKDQEVSTDGLHRTSEASARNGAG